MVDWDLAVQTARRMMKPGPQISPAQAREAVEELRSGAAEAEAHVRGYTGLQAEAATAPVVVVDRPGWVQANADGLRVVLRPLAAKVRSVRSPGGIANAVGPKVTGVEAGTLLGFLASKVLGQFDPFWPGPHPGSAGQTAGRLLLVAPNIVETERRLGVDPTDFRLWVCLHEVTHQLQFTAVPWLKDHLEAQMAEFVEVTDLDPEVLRDRLRDVLHSVLDAARGEGDGDDAGLMALVQDPAQRAVLDRVTAVMSLVEGHAEYVMDGVGPDVVPSVRTLRKRFAQRRKGRGPIDRVLRRLLGLEQKMKQYAEGRVFVGGVVERVGMEGFNRVWEGPENLPRIEELTDPARWVERVHGRPAIPA